MNAAYLCLGGNMGNRELSLELAIAKIGREAGTVKAVSSIYETEAWGVSNQQAYLNCCLELETESNAQELLRVLLHIEKELGRERNLWKTYEPRTIDLDILLFNRDVIEQERLLVPHPRLHLRNFVLVPLNEIAGDYLHPVLNKSIFNLLGECKDASDVVLYKRA